MVGPVKSLTRRLTLCILLWWLWATDKAQDDNNNKKQKCAETRSSIWIWFDDHAHDRGIFHAVVVIYILVTPASTARHLMSSSQPLRWVSWIKFAETWWLAGCVVGSTPSLPSFWKKCSSRRLIEAVSTPFTLQLIERVSSPQLLLRWDGRYCIKLMTIVDHNAVQKVHFFNCVAREKTICFPSFVSKMEDFRNIRFGR